jgi:enoyl-CoA hydratase/carnithine racemase
MTSYADIGVETAGQLGTIEIRRPPNNFFDRDLIQQIADAAEAFDRDPNVRVVVLTAQGKNFCAGADFANRPETGTTSEQGGGFKKHLYKEGIRLFRTKKPIVAAVQGAAIGGGLGLALMADFRVTCQEARFSANFTRMGFHPGFGLTVTLPRLVGPQKAALLFSTRETVRRGLADAVESTTERELVEQDWLRATNDFKEGTKAMGERRLPDFKGR